MDVSVIVVREDGIRWATVGEEIVLMVPNSDHCWQLNATAALVWELADGRSTICDMVAEIVVEFEADPEVVEQDVLELVTSMVGQGLLRLVGETH